MSFGHLARMEAEVSGVRYHVGVSMVAQRWVSAFLEVLSHFIIVVFTQHPRNIGVGYKYCTAWT
jgi:hypothetical protein